MSDATLCVVGSANLDIVVPVPHHPARGETVLGGDHAQIPGGKGANQAVAASRLGGSVEFVGRIGDDPAGQVLRQSLVEAGVGTDALLPTPETPSGIALITVDSQGDNAIVVSPGANSALQPRDLAGVAALESAAVVQLQLEIPIETVLAAASSATGTVVLDPAPAPPAGVPPEILEHVDVLIPNETELAILAGSEVDATNTDALASAARSLGVPTVIITLGAAGAVVVDQEGVSAIPAPVVEAVDTTAAGDAFRSAVAVSLAEGRDVRSAAEFGVRVGAATTLRFGAQPSLPSRDEVDRLLS